MTNTRLHTSNIIVISDDFTGAAELAGIALRFGLQLNVYLNTNCLGNADVAKDGFVINADSRSMKKQNALLVTENVFKHLANQPVSLLYKKIDSVLRGYVMDELKIQMKYLGLQKAIIAPANPSLGRTIEQGKYFINGQEITATDFVNDPEFPVKSSLVKEMLNDKDVEVLKQTDTLPKQGILVAEAITKDDVKNWANKIDNSFALAGAGDFFVALLEKEYQVIEQQETVLLQPFLYVAGSAFASATNRVKLWKQNAIALTNINQYFELIQTNDDHFVLAVQENIADVTALELRTKMATVVKDLVMQLNIKELFIEGGSTAASVLTALEVNILTPVNELSRGVVRMFSKAPLFWRGVGVRSLYITVKPGSYPLNEKILAH